MNKTIGITLVILSGVMVALMLLYSVIDARKTEEEIKFLNHEICEQSNELQTLHGWPESKRLNCETFKLRKSK